MATAPVFASTPKVGQTVVYVANTNRNGTGTLNTVYTAQSGSSLIYKIQANATGSTSAGALRFYLTDATLANPALFEEIIVPAITPSTTVRVFEYIMNFPQNSPLILISGSALKVSTNNNEAFAVFAFGGDI